MMLKVTSEQEILQEATEILLEHMEPAKFARLLRLRVCGWCPTYTGRPAQVWAACQVGGGDYLAIRDQLFAEETVTTLSEKIRAYQSESENE